MKLQYWGTAAAEGIPALFCDCKVCREAREKGGRYVRSRSQALIDGSVLVDFGADTYLNSVRFGFDTSKLEHVLITHVHEDHYAPVDFTNRLNNMCKHPAVPTLTVHGSVDVKQTALRYWELCGETVAERLFEQNRIAFHELKPYETYPIAGLSVTPLPATHNTPHPYVYVISKGEKTIFYFNDSGYLSEESMAYLRKNRVRFDLVSYDCTHGAQDGNSAAGGRHMGLPNNLEMKRRFIENGNYKDTTVSVITHFSHNIPTVGYGDMLKTAQANGFVLAYDGMEIEI